MKYVLHVFMYILGGIFLLTILGMLATIAQTTVNDPYPQNEFNAVYLASTLSLCIFIFTIGTRKVIFAKKGIQNIDNTIDVLDYNPEARYSKINVFQTIVGSLIVLIGLLFTLVMIVTGIDSVNDINSYLDLGIFTYIIAILFLAIGCTLVAYPIMIIYKSGRLINDKKR